VTESSGGVSPGSGRRTSGTRNPAVIQDGEPSFNIHICTKGGPDRLTRILADIASVVPEVDAVFVYDDSVDWVDRVRNRSALESAPFRTIYIDEPRRREFLRNLPWPGKGSKAYAEYAFKEMGNPAWDHAGVRTLAHFFAASLAFPGSKVLFLDDDIRLVDGVFQRKRYSVDSDAISALLSGPISDNSVIGAEYVGRADVYDVEHISHVLEAAAPGIEGYDHGLISTYEGDERDPSMHGDILISGAFLLLGDKAVRRVPPPHSYNEDIIVLTVLKELGFPIVVAPFKPLHTGDEKRIRWRTAMLQQVGVVIRKSLDQALAEVGMENISALVDRAVGHCESNAEESAASWKEIFSDPNRQFGEVHAHNMYALVDSDRIAREAGAAIVGYFGSLTGWRDLVNNPHVSAYVRSVVDGIR